MRNHWSFLTTLCLLTLSFSHAWAQPPCYGNPQAEASTCAYTPLTLPALNPCTGCTYTWTGTPVSGQGTPLATYLFTGQGWLWHYVYPQVTVYDPTQNCTYYDIFQTTVSGEPIEPLPALSNGPWDGDTGKVWLYTRSYLDPAQGLGMFYYNFMPTWTVTSGAINRFVHIKSGPFYYDSIFVKWNGAGPMVINESMQTSSAGAWYGVNNSCTWLKNSPPNSYPSLAVFHHPLCAGTPATFYTFPFANSTYTWSVTNGSVVSGQGTNSPQIVMAGNGSVSVQRDSAGTITNASATVTPFVPTMNLGPDINLCQLSTAVLAADSGFVTYQWSTGATTQSISVSNPGQYSVTASIYGGCVISDTINVTQIPAVAPNLGPDIHTCTFPVTLDAGPGYTSYQWSNGAATQTIAANLPGSYSVTVVDANGCSTSDAVLVFNSQVTVNLGSNANFCVPGTQTVTASMTNATSYLWSTGASTPSTQITGLGPQTVWLQASNVYGCVGSDTVVYTGLPRPTPNIGPDQTVCPGTAVTLDAGPGYVSYNWTPGPSTQLNTVTTPGTYRVTVTGANGCTGGDTMLLSNHPFVGPNLGPDINVCQATALLDAGAGYSTYLWSNGATTQTILASAAGLYSVTVTGVGGCTGSDAINVAFSPFTYSLGPDQNLCAPQSVTLDPQLAGSFTYLWSTGATTSSINVNTPGVHVVHLTATNLFGCSHSDTVLVTILPTPPLDLGDDTLMCADTTLTLDAGSGFTSYLWSTNATSQSIVATAGGVYAVTCTVANGCVLQDTILISSMIDCIFPGDINYDGIADVMDVLALGTTLGPNGTPRPNASLQWYGQWTWNWGTSFMTGVDRKQADADGNGTINIDDTLAIHNNYGSTHTRTGAITGGDSRVIITPLNTPVQAGDIARFTVRYEGDNGAPLDSVHGLALEMTWPTTGILGLRGINFNNAWFAPAGNRLTLQNVGPSQASIALSRTSGVDTSGLGTIMILEFATDPNMTPGQLVSFVPTVTNVQGVGVSLIPHSSQVVTTPLTVMGPVVVDPMVVAHARIWPVPAQDKIFVQVDGQSVRRVQLVNMMGQFVIDLLGNDSNEFTLDVSQLPAGNYCLQIQTQDGLMVHKIVIE
jgi:hypothetical protein